MAKPRPIRRLHIPLDGGYYLTCVFWRTEAQMQQAVGGVPDYRAITVCERESKLVARIHFSRAALDVGTIAHEVRHAIDHYHDRMHAEHLARMSERCLETIHEAVEDIT